MKKVLLIAVAVFCLASCSNDTIEEIQQEEQLLKELEITDIYARETEPEDDGTVDDGNTDEE
ncbi:MAG: hypothetical protein COA88_15775 [Kordia sp.]|nr:MAG: hypothetical protein COA88_15775 [Kordia sp.]